MTKRMTKRRAMEERLWSQFVTLKMNINMADITEKTENRSQIATGWLPWTISNR